MIETKSVTIARKLHVVSLHTQSSNPPRPLKVVIRYRKLTLNE
jgi:hypothetical protein